MKLYMLDTDIASYVIRGDNQHILEKFSQHVSHICISSITVGELLFGVEKRNSAALAAKVNSFCNLVQIYDWTEECARVYGKLRAALESKGSPLASMDMLIASAALALSATLVTNNMAHFSKVPRLKLENWVKPMQLLPSDAK